MHVLFFAQQMQAQCICCQFQEILWYKNSWILNKIIGARTASSPEEDPL
jgi:hypothetical protein